MMRKAHSLLGTGFLEALPHRVDGSVPYLGSEFSKEIGALPRPITDPPAGPLAGTYTLHHMFSASCSPPAPFQQKLS